MKKALTTILALALSVSLCVPAFGATDSAEPVSDFEKEEIVEKGQAEQIEQTFDEKAGIPEETESRETQEETGEILNSIPTSGKTGDCTWEFDEASGELIISGTGRMDKYASMADTPWIAWSDFINSVRIGNEITYVSNYAFAGSHIDSIVIPDSVTEIGEYAFYKCTNLSKVTLGSGLKKLCAGVFQTSDSTESVLTEITIPSNVEDIASHVFGYTCVSQTGEAPQKVKEFLIKAECGSAGYYYAKENEFLFETTKHHFDEREVVKEPTYYDYGEAELTCACGETKTELIKKLKRISIKAATVTVKDCTYTGKKRTPAVTVTLNGKKLKKNTDYLASYKNNIKAGTAVVTVTGEGNYTGSVKASFTIKPASIKKAEVTLSRTKYTYNGKERKPAVTVVLNGTKLKKDRDYTVSYKKNINAGTATVTIAGKGNYKGSTVKTFIINPLSFSSRYFKENGALDANAGRWTGKAVKPGADGILKVDGEYLFLKAGRDFTVTYKNNVDACYVNGDTAYLYADKPQPTAIITGIGNFKGTVKRTFNIYPPYSVTFFYKSQWTNTLPVGEGAQLEILVDGYAVETEGYKKGVWKSETPKIASVSKTGYIKAKKAGTALITYIRDGHTIYKLVYVTKK